MVRNKLAIAAIAATLVGSAQAVLPPQYQTAKDLDVMVGFIKDHPTVASTLRLIDMQKYVVHFGADCRAEFARKTVWRMPGWVGPAEPLEFVRSNCKLD